MTFNDDLFPTFYTRKKNPSRLICFFSTFQPVTVTLADLKIAFVIRKLVNVNVVCMLLDERAIAASPDIGIWIRSGDVRIVNAIRMEVSMKIVTNTRVNVFVSRALKVSNVIDVEAVIMDFLPMAAKVRFIEHFFLFLLRYNLKK